MIEKLTSPRLVVDKAKCEANIKKMVSKINKRTSSLRPHFKTHQSSIIGEWFKNSGISKITVSSLEMALYFAENGWKDITIALPFNIHWLPIVNKYAKKIHFNFLIEDEFVFNEIIRGLKYPCGIFIKIDLGSNRTGISPYNFMLIDKLTEYLKLLPNDEFKGFLGHAGHTYNAKNINEIKDIYFKSSSKMDNLKSRYNKLFPNIITSYGYTPSCSVMDELSHFDEYRPGNFVFYDLMQYHLGSCKLDDIALVVACPVLAKHEERNEIIVHCGAIHLSKDFIEVEGMRVYGQVVLFNADNTWIKPQENVYVKSLSQEHGILKVNNDIFKKISVGNTLGIIPVHSCLTAYQMRYEYWLNEDAN